MRRASLACSCIPSQGGAGSMRVQLKGLFAPVGEVAILGLALWNLRLAANGLGPDFLPKRDLNQDIAMARTMVRGQDPYAWPTGAAALAYPLPSAHPPTLALMLLP